MYPNLEAELKRRNIKRAALAEVLGCAISTITAKMQHASEFTFDEAKKIKAFLGVDIPLEILFSDKPDAPAV